MKNSLKLVITVGILLIILVDVLLIRGLGEREIDDITPGIYCEPEYIAKSDVLWIIPYFNNTPISYNKSWCNYILGLNKTLGLHGVYHTYNEFGEARDGDYLDFGIREFEKCFGEKPRMFKAPQLNLSVDNVNIIKERGMEIHGYLGQFFHKIYHCSDTGLFSNKFVDSV